MIVSSRRLDQNLNIKMFFNMFKVYLITIAETLPLRSYTDFLCKTLVELNIFQTIAHAMRFAVDFPQARMIYHMKYLEDITYCVRIVSFVGTNYCLLIYIEQLLQLISLYASLARNFLWK